jgi:hypothetical protein
MTYADIAELTVLNAQMLKQAQPVDNARCKCTGTSWGDKTAVNRERTKAAAHE